MVNEPAQIKREWWVERWLELLDKYRFKKRLERARNYARQGNVLSIDFAGEKVIAQVQGTEPEPYQVSLFMAPFSDEQWHYIIESMAQKASFSARLLSGEMPANLEEVFVKNGVTLFPYTLEEIHSRCSCPDKVNPCKHIGAIYYLLGDRFSEDPFVLFQLRGRSKEQILTALRQIRSTGTGEQTSKRTKLEKQDLQAEISCYSLRGKKFWQYNQQLEPGLVVIVPPPSNGTVLDVLGAIPLAVDLEAGTKSASIATIMEYLNKVYTNVSQQAVLSAMAKDT